MRFSVKDLCPGAVSLLKGRTQSKKELHMTTVEPKSNVRPATARYSQPANASTALDHHSLAKAIEASAGGIDDRLLTSVAPADAGHALQPRTLLAVLAFSYARQIYASAGIEAVLRADCNFAFLGRRQLPDARILRRFRRENREALLVCVKAGLRFVTEQKVGQGLLTHVNETRLAEEASRRIIMAMFTDSMAMNKDQTTDAPMDLCYLFANSPPRAH